MKAMKIHISKRGREERRVAGWEGRKVEITRIY
jgi:hypothetical protein